MGTVDTSLPIGVNNPRKLGVWQIPAERIAIMEGYKPTVALLPDGEMVMMALYQEYLPDRRIREWNRVWRSRDGGLSWSGGKEVKDIIGREHYLTSTREGILFTTCHLLSQDINNADGYTHSYLHRSADGGRTWTRLRIGPEGFPSRASTTLFRNLVEMPEGVLLLSVGVNVEGEGHFRYIWTSRDGGISWDRSSQPVITGGYAGRTIPEGWEKSFKWKGFDEEGFTYRMQSGKLLHIIRCGSTLPMYPMSDGRAVPQGADTIARMLRCESTDNGRTRGELQDFGDYGMHYPRLLRLRDGRVLLTFTQRDLFYPIGLQAVLSDDDGERWDFHNDRIVIEGKTPWGAYQGGGFGNTAQLADGDLVSCYSYRGADDRTYIEMARWRLPT